MSRLFNEMLLQRCLKGLTQNQNETRTKFNKGVAMKAVVMKNVGCVPKDNMMTALRREDQRVDFSERKISDKPGSHDKNRLDWKRKKVENSAYLSGGFGVSSKPDSILSLKRVTIKFTDEKTS